MPPYPSNTNLYSQAHARLNNATYGDLERLRTEFDEYDNGLIPVRHYKHKGNWYAKPITGGTAQALSIKVIQQHGRNWRVQKRSNGQLRKWTYATLQEAQRKRDMVFG